MKSVLIVIIENCVAAHVTDTLRFFSKSNELLEAKGNKPLFEVQTVGFSKTIWLKDGRLTFTIDKTIDETNDADLIVIPSFSGDAITATQLNRHYHGWLIKQYERGAEVASFANGSFLLAAAGLLNEKACSVNRNYNAEFIYYYEKVKVDTESLLTESKGIYTCGGETSYWHLLLHILGKFTERQLMLDIANYFMISNKIGTDLPASDPANKNPDRLVQDILQYIDANITKKITAAILAKTFFVNKRTLERRFLKATNELPGNYIQKQKIELAKKELQSGYQTIPEVMRQIGYSDIKTFRIAFRKFTGILPAEYASIYRCPLWSKTKRAII